MIGFIEFILEVAQAFAPIEAPRHDEALPHRQRDMFVARLLRTTFFKHPSIAAALLDPRFARDYLAELWAQAGKLAAEREAIDTTLLRALPVSFGTRSGCFVHLPPLASAAGVHAVVLLPAADDQRARYLTAENVSARLGFRHVGPGLPHPSGDVAMLHEWTGWGQHVSTGQVVAPTEAAICQGVALLLNIGAPSAD